MPIRREDGKEIKRRNIRKFYDRRKVRFFAALRMTEERTVGENRRAGKPRNDRRNNPQWEFE